MTIKRNGEKVILKDKKVSCSCCETECCMYPAQALADGLYSAADLPDSVILNYDLVENFELTRSGSEFLGGIYKIALGIPENSTETEWILYINNEKDNAHPCLIQGDGLAPDDAIVEDQFADTYTATLTGGYQVPPPPITLTRVSLCTWEGFEGEQSVRLSYKSPERPIDYIVNFSYKWNLSWRDCLRTKSNGIQNTPVGSYNLCYVEEETCTIS